MNSLTATLRLQFHADFSLDDAVPLVPYFARLGISHLYASPLLQARPGSRHGYDVVDPTRVSPELGGEAAIVLIQPLAQACNLHVLAPQAASVEALDRMSVALEALRRRAEEIEEVRA